MKDKIVEEVRKHRLAHTRKFKGDLSDICDDLLRIQLESGHKIVRLSPKKLTTIRSSARANKIGDCP
ncbi:MAG: hypothetical protein NTV89_17690 [Proteobacteria bacterium]|nr:hypothetical protein [Pseudomonadota bacterium]